MDEFERRIQKLADNNRISQYVENLYHWHTVIEACETTTYENKGNSMQYYNDRSFPLLCEYDPCECFSGLKNGYYEQKHG